MILGLELMIGTGCQPDPSNESRAIRPVRFQTVGSVASGTERNFSGTAATEKIVNLSFRSSGIITRLDVRLGAEVEKGQLLAQLDNVQARLAYEQARSSVNSAASQMNTAQLNLERFRSLYEKGSASLSEYENAKNTFRTSEASHESAQRSVDIQAEQMRYGFLYAPESGVISVVNAEINENVSAGTTIAVLNAGRQMQISVGLPESVINQVKVGMTTGISFSALPGENFAGTIAEISPATSGSSGTYPVLVTIEAPSPDIRAGMAADVQFRFVDSGRTRDFIVVPANAVGEDGEGRFVFVLEPQGEDLARTEKTYVQLGQLSSDGFEIREGLQNGQLIATAGLHTLLNGQEVRLGR